MKKSCLVVVDMINGFLKEGALSDTTIQKIIPNVKQLIEKYVDQNQAIINFQDAHEEEAAEFSTFPKHCVKGSFEAELIEELKIYEKSMITLYKNSTNGFMQPQFLPLFNDLDCDEVVVVGCCSDICVLQFTLSLQGYINEHNLKIKVKVAQDAIETFDAPGHNQLECNRTTIKLLQGAGVEVINARDVI